ncbi:MAG: Protease HtpX-like protein [Candidatus Beckwithbacteria bacterium GW2011_GWB1_47_15]|uniref:Protease HtpX homolog n=1 Tax=Candidatus Beckwithbacteria bacterium GW2011_GWB1_47_15 TaxID=1618371 RepID=A0A0G1RTV5_9BACT|nr:MAG: HtpX-2 peptidase, heat shock protein HtpX [Candidatus Beckwithbacteria bacterium GW2011_GWC1_49_16]KKU35085.1 MAG: Protease HtpX-like protein [Candidatus Beckwithbacteria bacterium GW2011_GWA1_46_30]KKU60729.1 MAG: Protease HtpX-like protein [Candidatus Beckwithbacteria bacterium GW2011_GWB1_47_15]KKU71534.1 MAG: Protease HtpX-like protein [Candidatus Beckwithbacteria bacterium GW2011_GWA2_47_25]KKW03513.1 MAG: Protease HtpX-like protein [Candidatus Beckwithbacteria bacterium GW2011_GWC
MLNVYEQVDRNKRKSALIIAFFVAFIALVAWVLGEASGYGLSWVGLALIFSGLVSFFSYYNSDKIILAISKARPASRKKDFKFYTVTENLCLATRLPLPKLYVIDDSAPNAFATGRDPGHAVVCATTGLIDKLDRTELEGVIAHELSHIKNYDIRVMSLVTVLVGLVTLLADWFLRATYWGRGRDNDRNQVKVVIFVVGVVLALLSPLIANLIKLAVSRRRELLADASAVKITRFPQGLARALEKISHDREPLEAANKATAHLYIANPLKNRHDSIGWFAGLFNTHPPVSERIRALRQMA